MDTLDLNALRLFAAVVETGGFTAAAERLGIAKSKVSQTVARLEAELGTSLFARSTRRVQPTPAGEALYREGMPLLGQLDALLGRLGENAEHLAGSLRVATSVDHASQCLGAALAAFARLHPDLQIELRCADHVQNIVEEGMDLAFRVGWLRDSSLRAVHLADFDQVLVAAPDYLARAGTPTRPEALPGHAWVCLSLLPTPLTWRFTHASGESATLRMQAALRTDSPTALRALLEAGAGVSVLDALSARAALADGRLQALLPDWTLPRGGLFAVYPPGRHPAASARAFVAFYREWLARRPDGPTLR